MANPYMPLYTGDYLRKTRRLTDREHGAYLLILFALWDEGGSIPFDLDDLKMIARVPSKTRNWETSVWPKIAPFFIISEGRLSHGRVTETLADLADKRKINTERAHKAVRAKQQKRKQNNGSKQLRDSYELTNQTKGLVSSLREEKPNLAIDEMKHVAASPPSPLEGGGDATETVQQIPILPDAAREVLAQLRDLNARGKVSLQQMTEFKRAVQGERAGRVLLIPGYEPPETIAAIINQPKLKVIGGTDFDPH